MSKTAAVVLAFLSLIAFTTASRAQLLPSGNVYVGAAYADNVDVVNRLTFRGFDGSLEDFALRRFSYLSFVLDGSGFFAREYSNITFFWDRKFPCITESGAPSCI